MFLADIRAECGVCGNLQLQRFYHATPLHPVTTATLVDLALDVRSRTAFECPNCASAVGPADALSTAFTWAFPDDAGLIRGFLPVASDPDSLRWQFVRERRLDPQELPGWAPDPAASVRAELDDDEIFETFGRALNPKVVFRDALSDWGDDPAGGAVVTISRDMTLVAPGPDVCVDELVAELDIEGVPIALDDCVPADLPTHREPARIIGAMDGWLPPAIPRAGVRVYLRPEAAFEVLERAFDVANLTRVRDEHGYRDITTPREVAYPRPLPIVAVLQRAVYTGLTPGDAARLCAEEIVGTLLRVW